MNDSPSASGCCATSSVCPCRLAMAVALTWGLGLLIVGLITCATQTYGHEFVRVVGSVYLGYEPASVLGAVIGFAWGFVDGFIAVAVVGLIYGLLSKCGGSCDAKSTRSGDASTT